jgi:hypothetical protein
MIARILLEPSSPAEAYALADHLFSVRAITRDLVGRTDTLEILKPLLAHSDPVVRTEACLVLAEAMYDYNGCLQRLLNDPNTPRNRRIRIEKKLQALAESRRQLYYFQIDPTRWIRSSASTADPEEAVDLLRLLSRYPDPAIRSRACHVLRERFPQIQEAVCIGR